MADPAPTEDWFADEVERFEIADGVELIVHGDESRTQLARRVIENREATSAQAVRLLESFMRDRGTFDLASVEVFATVTPNEGDFSLQFTFVADHDPHEYNYAYFEVFFFCHEPPQEPFWPFKFSVGFH